MTAVGTLPWAEATGGALRTRDKLDQLWRGTLTLLGTLPARIRYRNGGHIPGAVALDVASVSPPDTAAARDALELCQRLAPAYMVNHSLRTYWFARALGIQRQLEFDDEVLYLGGVLHDIALMPGFSARAPEHRCFSIPSAHSARRIAAAAGWDDDRQRLVAEAITLNPNASVSRTQGIEAHLLNVSVMIDAIGLRLWELHPTTIDSAMSALPRLDMSEGLVGLFHAEANANPGCRFHFARRYFGFDRRVVRSALAADPNGAGASAHSG